jgi:glycosyltransferase involved in cell wall biosynthesis
MMHRAGHHVVHLGVEGSQVECTEHVDVASAAEWSHFYSNPGTKPYELKCDGKFRPYHQRWAKRAKLAILERCDNDREAIVCVTYGGTQWEAVKGVDQFIVESGIGYPKAYAEWRVYESYAWLHTHVGMEGLQNCPKWYWPVIPNAFDLEMFTYNEKRGEDFLFIGRLNEDKGVRIAIESAKRAGRKITIAGQGDPAPFLAGNPHASYVGVVDVEGRRKLLSECKAVFCPSWYHEPFCGVSIEAQISGAPVICTDWGAFPENVVHGVTGYRCRTMDHFTWAAKKIDAIDPQACRDWAKANFSLERIAPMYTEYFESVLKTRDRGTDWNAENAERTELDWLRKQYPTSLEFAGNLSELAPNEKQQNAADETAQRQQLESFCASRGMKQVATN